MCVTADIIDCIVVTNCEPGPTTPHSTCPHNSYWYVGYTAMFNLLDYSAVSFPTGICVDKTVDGPYPVELAPLNEVDQRIRDTCMS
jgi:amidase